MISLIYKNSFFLEITFVFNLKFYFNNKLKITNRLRFIYLYIFCLQNNRNFVYRT